MLGDLYLADDHPIVAAEAAELLASTALLLDRDPIAHLTLEAYCDERGTEAYSFLIGQGWVLDVEEFGQAWTETGSTHHFALGVGHQLGKIEKLAKMLNIELVTVCK